MQIMSDSELPPESVPPSAPSSPPAPEGREREGRRRRLEGVIPEIVRRAVELGVEKARESPDNLKQLVNDLKLPKDIAHYIFQQIDETKNGLFRVVAKEIRDFLEHTNFAGELQNLLTTVQFEVNTTIRFTPNDGRNKPNKPGKGSDKPENKSSDKGAPSSTPSSEDRSEEIATDAESATPSSDTSERTTRLPKPEVKTAVHVRRDERDRRRRSEIP